MRLTAFLPRLLGLRLLALLLSAAAGSPSWAQAPSWPAKPVRIVVGFSAGGPTDVLARAFAEHASRTLGQAVIVDNKPGANTILAAEAVAAASADGHTLLMAATNHTMIPALYSSRVKFDALRSFAPICTLAVSPTVLVTGPALPAKTLSAFLQQVREAPGQRSYGTPGVGSSGHFATEQFLRKTGLSMNHIPYKGAAQVVTDLVGGQLESSFATLGSVLPQVQAGKLQALAVASPRRSALLPQVPTFAEAGVKGYVADAWYGLLAPAGTPADIVSRVQQEVAKALATPAMKEKLAAQGAIPSGNTPAEFARFIEAEHRKWAQVVKASGAKVD